MKKLWQRENNDILLSKSKGKDNYFLAKFKPEKKLFSLITKKYFIICSSKWVSIFPMQEGNTVNLAGKLFGGESKMKYYDFVNINNDGLILSNSADKLNATVQRMLSMKAFI